MIKKLLLKMAVPYTADLKTVPGGCARRSVNRSATFGHDNFSSAEGNSKAFSLTNIDF